MESELSSSGISFNLLAKKSGFINLIVENITSCVLLLNSKMELQAYNDALKTIFSNRADEDLLYQRCGEAIGCANTVEEMKQCGTTSKCKFCPLREAAMISYIDKQPIYKENIERDFFTREGKKVRKNLIFSTRPFEFENENYIIVIIEDITKYKNQQKLIQYQKDKIDDLISKN